jgi:transcriptional regulator with XRE-family HTH domain
MPRRPKKGRDLGRHYLKEWRAFRHLTQEQSANRIGVDRSLLSKLENYRAQYTQQILEECAVAYDCTVEQLLFVDPNFQDVPRLVYDSLRRASPDKQRQAVAVIEALLKAS